MSLVKRKSNAPAVLRHIQQSDLLASATVLGEGALLKVLGIAWAPGEDHFCFQLARLIDSAAQLRRVRKRAILQIVASMYDPVGWLTPFTLRGKLIIQQLWSQTLKWDDPVDDQVLKEFRMWTNEMRALSTLRIPRPHGASERTIVSRQLHVFGDASEKAFAATTYLQSLYSDGSS